MTAEELAALVAGLLDPRDDIAEAIAVDYVVGVQTQGGTRFTMTIVQSSQTIASSA